MAGIGVHGMASRPFTAVRRSRHAVGLQLLFFFVVVLVYGLTADYDQVQNEDIVATAVPAWNLVANGSTDLAPFEDVSQWIVNVDGRVISNRWPGSMLVALVFYSITAPFYVASRGPVLWPATIAAVFVSAAATTVLFRLLWATFGRRFGFYAALVVAFGTGLWTVAAEGLWTHGPSALITAAALLALRAQRQWSAGICFGALALVRPHLLIVAAIVGYVTARETKDMRALLRIGLPSAVGLALYLAYVSALVGHPSLGVGYYAFRPPQGWGRLLNILGVAIAPRVGLLVYTPVLLCCVPQLSQAWSSAPVWERASALGGVTYLVIQLQLNHFFGGYGFYGYRIPLDGLVFALPLLCRSAKLFVDRSDSRAVVTAVLAAASVWISAIGAFSYVGRPGDDDPWTTWGLVDALATQPVWKVVLVCAGGVGAMGWIARVTQLAHATPLEES